MRETVYLFVYGTLRREYGSPFYEEHAEELEWMGTGEISGKLYDIGEYPGASPQLDVQDSIILGDVFKLREPKKFLELLDQYENYDPLNAEGSEYVRGEVSVRLENKEQLSAWIYWYNGSLAEKKIIREKDYLNYLNKKAST